MNQEETIKNLETILWYYKVQLPTGRLQITPEHQQLIKQVYSSIYKVPESKLLTTCYTCVSQYLNNLNAQYEKITGRLYELPTPEPEVETKPKAKKGKK